METQPLQLSTLCCVCFLPLRTTSCLPALCSTYVQARMHHRMHPVGVHATPVHHRLHVDAQDGLRYPLTPNDARLRNLTYSGNMFLDMTLKKHFANGRVCCCLLACCFGCRRVMGCASNSCLAHFGSLMLCLCSTQQAFHVFICLHMCAGGAAAQRPRTDWQGADHAQVAVLPAVVHVCCGAGLPQ